MHRLIETFFRRQGSRWIFLFFIAIGIHSCCKRQDLPSIFNLEESLEQAGNNRAELEKVLHHYQVDPADSLKYQAACFLIENMPYYGFYKGELLEHHLKFYHLLAENRDTKVTPTLLADSVLHMYGAFCKDSLFYYRDIQTIDSAYLCNNIEWAFKVWKEQPWGRHVSFADFCEYILPYRIGDEALYSWREEIYQRYNPMLDSLRASNVLDKEDPAVAARVLLDSIRQGRVIFTTTSLGDLPHVGPKVSQLKAGSCREFTDFTIYVCRALGIPCAVDFMPIRGDENDGHQWVAFADKYGTPFFEEFPDELREVRKDKMCTMPKIKVYRTTFSLNKAQQNDMLQLDTALVPFFCNPHFIDVTFSYTKDFKKELKIPESAFYKGKSNAGIAYLCASKYMQWKPVAWTAFNKKRLVFTDIQKGAVMRVATYEKGKLRFWTDPFEISASNNFRFFTPLDSTQHIVLFAKYSLRGERMFQKRMQGGRFEGSNDPYFRKKEILHVIDNQPERLQTTVRIHPSNSYRYIRYIGPDGAYCNVAEVAFYQPADTAKLKGEVIGTPGCYQKDRLHEYTNVFDDDLRTSFDYIEPSGGWSGLDLKARRQIAKIVYTPRHYDNYIRPGDKYELFYCAGIGWKSLGKQVAGSDSLAYRNVPVNVLLLLKNHSRGNQERIFIYENGKQIWK